MHLHQSKAQFCSLLCCNWFIIQWIYADMILKQMALSLIVPSIAFSVRACVKTQAPQASWMCRTTDFLLLTIWMQNHELCNLWPALLFLSTKLRDRVVRRSECLIWQKVTVVGCGCLANGVRVWMLDVGGTWVWVYFRPNNPRISGSIFKHKHHPNQTF